MSTSTIHSESRRKAHTLPIYALAFVLVALLETGRLGPVLERWGSTFPPAAHAAILLSKAAQATGLEAFSHAESLLAHTLNTERTIGSLAAADPSEGSPSLPVEAPLQHLEHPVPALPQPATTPLPRSSSDPAEPAPKKHPQDTTGILSALPTGQTSPNASTPPSLPKTPPKVLIVGDSLIMEGFGPVLQRNLRARKDLEVVREGRYSTGLSRPDQLDWPEHLRVLVQKHHPDVIIVCLGANDPQDIIDADKKRHIAGTPSWQAIYRARAEKFLQIAGSEGASVIWSGLPVMGRETYDKRIRILSDVQRTACENSARCLFVDNRRTLAGPHGEYLNFAVDEQGRHVRLRYKDKIHVTEDGGKRLAAVLIPALESTLKQRQERPVAQDQAAPQPFPHSSSGTSETRTGQRAPATIKKIALTSRYLDRETTYYAFLPGERPDRPQERFPFVVLLHGAGGSQEDWKKQAGDLLAEQVNKQGVAVLIPTAGPYSWYADSSLDIRGRAGSFLLDELLPHAERHLPLSARRGIAGLSMGGHGAFTLSLRHPGLFASVSSMSGVMDITRHPEQWHIKDIFGPLKSNRAAWEAHSAFFLLRALKPESAPAMLVSAGSEDAWVIEENRAFRDRAVRLGLKLAYRELPGRHDWKFWRQELPVHLEFHSRTLCAPDPATPVELCPATGKTPVPSALKKAPSGLFLPGEKG